MVGAKVWARYQSEAASSTISKTIDNRPGDFLPLPSLTRWPEFMG